MMDILNHISQVQLQCEALYSNKEHYSKMYFKIYLYLYIYLIVKIHIIIK